jgi:hypothetical protein
MVRSYRKTLDRAVCNLLILRVRDVLMRDSRSVVRWECPPS